MQKAFILSEEEYSMVQGQAQYIEQLQNELATLKANDSVMLEESSNLQETVANLNKEVENLKCLLRLRDLQIVGMRKDFEGTEKALADARQDLRAEQNLRKDMQEELQHCQKISAMRLENMNRLAQECHNLKYRNRVHIVTNPKTGTVRVVGLSKVDTYRRFGWVASEEYLVDHPA